MPKPVGSAKVNGVLPVPAVASVGLTSVAARAAGHDVAVATFPLGDTARVVVPGCVVAVGGAAPGDGGHARLLERLNASLLVLG